MVSNLAVVLACAHVAFSVIALSVVYPFSDDALVVSTYIFVVLALQGPAAYILSGVYGTFQMIGFVIISVAVCVYIVAYGWAFSPTQCIDNNDCSDELITSMFFWSADFVVVVFSFFYVIIKRRKK